MRQAETNETNCSRRRPAAPRPGRHSNPRYFAAYLLGDLLGVERPHQARRRTLLPDWHRPDVETSRGLRRHGFRRPAGLYRCGWLFPLRAVSLWRSEPLPRRAVGRDTPGPASRPLLPVAAQARRPLFRHRHLGSGGGVPAGGRQSIGGQCRIRHDLEGHGAVHRPPARDGPHHLVRTASPLSRSAGLS